jgi:hypothetical protein
VLVCGPVVRDLDDVDAREVLTRRREQAPLRDRREVAEVEEGQAPAPARVEGSEQGDDARVVARRPDAGRPEHRPAELAQDSPDACLHLEHLGAARGEAIDEALVVLALRRADQGSPDPARDDVEGTDVVGVEVREHEEVDTIDPEPAQAADECLLVVAHVDHRDLAGAPDEDRVALADVALRDRPVVGHRSLLPRADARRDTGDDHERADEDHDDRPAHGSASPRQHGTGHEERESCQDEDPRHAAEPLDPGQRPGRDRPRDRAHPGGRHPRGTCHDLCDARCPGGGRADDQAPDGRDRRGWLGQHVRHDAVHRQARVEQEQHGLARELRGHRHCEHGGQGTRHEPGERVGERSREHDQPRRGEDGQREAQVAGQPRVDDEQARDRQGDDGQPRHRPGRREVHEHDEGHDRRADDARLGGDEPEEGEQQPRREHDPEEARHPDGPSEEHHQRHEHSAVRPGDRGQVGQGGGLHRLVEVVPDGGRVADGEAGQEAAAVARQLGGHGPEVGAHGVGEPCRP